LNEVEVLIFDTMQANGGQNNVEALRVKWSMTQAKLRKHNEANFQEDAFEGEKYGLSWTKMKFE
jgi:hypothetical protein